MLSSGPGYGTKISRMASRVRTPSRKMPSVPMLGPFGTTLFVGLLLALLASPGLLWWPLALVMPVFFLIVTLIGRVRDQKVARARRGESICEFARAFNYREIDTRIIRAVYEEYSGPFPVRPSDNFIHDLRRDDLDETTMHIARRIGRSLDRIEDNSIRNVSTVRDLVLFLHHQPLVASLQAQQ